jgi:hypothetical protein
VVNGGDEVAKDAAVVALPGGKGFRNSGAHGAIGGGDVGEAPGTPEVIRTSNLGYPALLVCILPLPVDA